VVFLHTEQTMEEGSVLSIQEAFGDLKDPRSRTPTHNLEEMLVVALCAILCGAETWSGIQIWAQGKLSTDCGFWSRASPGVGRDVREHAAWDGQFVKSEGYGNA
jgi:hypothetical protein